MPNFFDQFDDQIQARVTTQPKSAEPNFFDQFDEPQEPSIDPPDTPERAALVAELEKRTAAADESGKNLKRIEGFANTVRPILRGATDLADGALSLPKLAAAVPVGALNLLGANLRSPLSYSVKDISPGAREALAPRNDSERLQSGVNQALGGVLGGFGAGGALARGVGTSSNVGKTLLANPALQTAGAVTGAGSGELARRSGAGPVGQTVAAVLGSMVPSTMLQLPIRTASRAASGLARTPEAQRLINAGVDLSPGQMNPKGFYNQLEETVQSAPFVGPIVRNARDNARATFQRAAAERGSAPGARIAQSDAAQMLDDAYQSFKPLYDKAKGFPARPLILNTNGPNVPLNQALRRAVGNRGIRATADDRSVVQNFLDDQLTKPLQSSDDLLNVRSAVRSEARAARASDQSAQAQLLDDADAAVTQALDSQLPPDALRALRTADAKYGDYKTLEKAVARGSTKDEGFTPFDLSQSVSQANRGANLGGYARGGGGPMRELAIDARKSMDVRAPATGQRLAALPVATVASPFILGLTGTQAGRRLAQGATGAQQSLSKFTNSSAVQRAISDPYQEQLALALQQAIELQKRRQSEGMR